MSGSTFEFDRGNRAKSYLKITNIAHSVRRKEIQVLLTCAKIKYGHRVLDYTSGGGILIPQILMRIGRRGQLYVIEPSVKLYRHLRTEWRGIENADVRRRLSGTKIPSRSLDRIVSLATIHHVDQLDATFKQLARLLKPGGQMAIGDVVKGTRPAKYFNVLVDRHSSTGHKHEFLDRVQLNMLCRRYGFRLLSWRVSSVPWEFNGEKQAERFLCSLHDVDGDCTSFFWASKKYLKHYYLRGKYFVDWQLFFAVLEKK